MRPFNPLGNSSTYILLALSLTRDYFIGQASIASLTNINYNIKAFNESSYLQLT